MLIPDQYHGLRTDAALAKLFPDYSRSRLTAWLKAGKITLDGQVPKPRDKVFGGETVKLDEADCLSEIRLDNNEPEDIPLNIMYEDADLLVINKPAGMIVHPGAGNPKHTLLNALLHHAPAQKNLPRAGIIHRLDKETTGLMVVAKTLKSQTRLSNDMLERLIHRRYITLVQGHLISGGVIETGYGRHPRNRLKMAVCSQGREAITRYFIRRQYQDFTLLDVELCTGRTHQIRVHMEHIRHPVVGDPMYGARMRVPKGAEESLLEQFMAFKRQALHAFQLEFTHPETEEILTFEAPLPDDFKRLLIALDTHYG